MHYGRMGTILEVDLSSGNMEKTEPDEEFHANYIGGKGANAKLFWDRVRPETEPFSPDNPIIISNGVLVGTIVPAANRAVMTFRSPVTGLHQHSVIGGLLPAQLKHAGYDTLVLSGRAPKPVYLWIDDDTVELRDASHLWGKSTLEAKGLIRQESSDPEVQVMGIGRAGENRVYSASVEDGFGASASRGGIGAIFGDKNLKALAVRGTRDIYIADPQKLNELCGWILQRMDWVRQFQADAPYTYLADLVHAGMFGNVDTLFADLPPELQRDVLDAGNKIAQMVEHKRVRETSCHNCPVRCKHAYPVPGGGYSFIKCSSWFAFLTSTFQTDFELSLQCYAKCEELGLDTESTSRYVGFAIDLFQKGILTEKDTDGVTLAWRDAQTLLWLIDRIAAREGIGDVLANGVYQAARQIGNGAEEHAHHIKKMEPIPPLGTELLSPWGTLVQAVSDMADPTRSVSTFSTVYWRNSKAQKYIDSDYNLYPKEYEKDMLAEFDHTGDDPGPGCRLAAYDQEIFTITDILGVCNFVSGFHKYPAIHTCDLKAQLIAAATGMEIDEAGLTRVAQRIVTLVRACNNRLGLRRKDDTIPKRYFEMTPEAPTRKLDPAKFDNYLDTYYGLRGWSPEGIPMQETLVELDLGYVSDEFERDGIG